MTASSIVLSGSLRFIGMGELLQLLGGNASTGRLILSSSYAEQAAHVYIVDGNPVNAEFGEFRGLDALNRLFGWMDADYEFRNEPVHCEHVIKKGRMEIILDALRMVDDGEIEKIGASPDVQEQAGTGDNSPGLPVVKGPLVDYIYVVDEEEFSAGKEIVYQEKYGNWFWVILDGQVDVIRLLPEGNVPVTRLSDGAFIGSIGSFLRKGNLQRSATVTAVTRVQLGVMDYDLLLKEFSELSSVFQAILASIDNRLRQITTSCARTLINGPSPQPRMGEWKRLENLEEGGAVYMISEGQAAIVRRMNGGFVELCILEPNDMIGYIPFLNTPHEPHSASVFVSDDFSCTPVDLMDLKKEYDRMSTTFKNVIKHTTTCVSVTTGRLFDVIKAGQDGINHS
ncbi:MAG TPA: cyclic nucleotide-binding domain-containing protein [Desulfosalsimonadaceae bacterium]|nr:cyclic nucleotide-binding domain-containing protein [Desulfosalsimonadaceae bacterium]